MQRNWDVIRRILLKVEALPTLDDQVGSDQVENVDGEIAAYHMRLLIQAGLIRGGCRDALGPAWCYATSLTWEGHEFLDAIRRDTVWNRIKATARERGLDLSFEVVKVAAKAVVDSLLKT